MAAKTTPSPSTKKSTTEASTSPSSSSSSRSSQILVAVAVAILAVASSVLLANNNNSSGKVTTVTVDQDTTTNLSVMEGAVRQSDPHPQETDDDGVNFDEDTMWGGPDDDDDDDDDDDGYDGSIEDCPDSNIHTRWWWTDLDPEEQECLIKYKGFTEQTWNCHWKDEDFIAWKDLSPDRQKALELRNYDEESWEKKRLGGCAPHGGQGDEQGKDGLGGVWNDELATADIEDWETLTIIRKADMPAIKHLSLDFIAETFDDLRIRTIGSYIAADKFVRETRLSEYVRKVQAETTQEIIHLEEGMMEKSVMYERAGKLAMESLIDMLSNHTEALENEAWLPEYNQYLRGSDYDWAMFVGTTNSESHMHYDSDSLQCLYIAEGRKRVVVMPNDIRTKGKFPVWINYDGGTVYTELDMLHNTSGIRELFKTEEGDENPPVEVIDVILEAGDAIVMPYLSWHAIQNLEPTLAFSLRIV